VHLELLQNQLEQMGHNSNIIQTVFNTGKIYMQTELLDDILQEHNGKKTRFENLSVYTNPSTVSQALKNNLKNLNYTKDKINANKTERFRSIVENNNEFLKNIKNRKNLSTEELYEDIEDEKCKNKLIFSGNNFQ
jgi:hypothetical protein